ncbi:uridine kinase-like protein, partial [Kipferlia bialata]
SMPTSTRLIMVAGPSSSGKATFAARLAIHLRVLGRRPVVMSLDDYYLPPHQAPKGPDGHPDLEHVKALDLSLLNAHLAAIISGQKVTTPEFNYLRGTREVGRTIQLAPGGVLICEGIHAINPRMVLMTNQEHIFKVY